MSTQEDLEGIKLIKDPANKIRKKIIITNVLVAIALPLFAYYLGYKNSNWLLEFVCLIFFPFVAYNAVKYLFKKDYRRNLNEYHDRQRALPNGGNLYRPVYSKAIIFFAMMLYLIIILAGIILKFFNLL
jgi:hypothetical protein